MSRRTASVASSVEQPSTGQTSWGCTVGSATRSWSTTTATSQNPARRSLKRRVRLIFNLTKLAPQVFCCQIVPSPRRCLHQTIKLLLMKVFRRRSSWTMKLQFVQVFRRQVDLPNSPQQTTKIPKEAFSRAQKLHFFKCALRRVEKRVCPPRLLHHSIIRLNKCKLLKWERNHVVVINRAENCSLN